MTAEREVALLHKEIRFLEERWKRFQHDLREVQIGQTRVVVGGLASPHFAFMMYIHERTWRARTRLRELEEKQGKNDEDLQGS